MVGDPALPDVLGPGLRVVFCGTAGGERSAAVGAYYDGRGNQFWPTLHTIGLTPRRLSRSEFRTLPEFGIGLTDTAKCRAGTDAILCSDDFDVPGFRAKMAHFAPRAVAFNGKKAAEVFFGRGTGELRYGRRGPLVGTTELWVLPSTSGGARGFWDVEPWRQLALSIKA
jgi:double-stranded uracil-DNA glycosylase